MVQQGVMIATVRTYLGILDGSDAWEVSKYIIAIEKGDGIIVDYKTGDEYNAITRTEAGRLNISRKEIEIGKVYAVESLDKSFDRNKYYSDRQINKFIKKSGIFSDEYINMNKSSAKVMLKK